MKRSIVIHALASAILMTGVTAASAAPTTPPGPNCTPVLSQAQHGAAAIQALGAKLPEAALRNNMPADQLAAMLRHDSTLWLDTCGLAFYVEEKAPATSSVAPAPAAPFPYTQTFALHSKPGATKTIYLDFDGATISSTYGSAWLSYNGGASFFATPYDMDGSPTTWSTTEQNNIQDIWRRVAEDYSPFDVDVTTETPAAGVLERTDASDNIYGTTALITNDGYVGGNCGCGGVAYVGVFDYTGTSHETYQPAWVVTKGVGYGSKYVAEATSHEVGHNLGLSHDGTSTLGYYQGVSGQGWAPIMGVGYYQPLVQWSKGEYPDANQTQDDYSVIAANGVPQRADEDTNNAAGALPLTLGASQSGIISSRTDTDWFALTPSSSGAYVVTATPAALSPNLDIQLDVYDASLSLISSDNPTMAYVNGDVASGMGASVTFNATGGQTYYAKIDGIGKGTWTTGADYNDYGSVGQFSITATSSGLALGVSSLPSATIGRPYSTTVSGVGGSGGYQFAASGLPAGLSINVSSGVISGTPTATCACTPVVTVTDSSSTAVSSTLALTTVAAPAITTASLPGASRGVAYSTTVSATGGVAPLAWSATGLPSGLSMSVSTGVISGTPTADGTFTVGVSVAEANGAVATTTLSLIVTVPTLSITTSALANGTVGTTYSQPVAASGGVAPYAWVISGLPAGLTYSPSTGTISGTPTTAVSSQSVSVSVTDSRSVPVTVNKSLTLTVAVATLAVTTTSLPTASRTKSYSVQLAASGGSGSKSWAPVSGSLPTGITLSTGGLLFGKPTTRGTYSFTVRVTDSSGSATKAFSLKVN